VHYVYAVLVSGLADEPLVFNLEGAFVTPSVILEGYRDVAARSIVMFLSISLASAP